MPFWSCVHDGALIERGNAPLWLILAPQLGSAPASTVLARLDLAAKSEVCHKWNLTPCWRLSRGAVDMAGDLRARAFGFGVVGSIASCALGATLATTGRACPRSTRTTIADSLALAHFSRASWRLARLP